jgi:hypothetical protein
VIYVHVLNGAAVAASFRARRIYKRLTFAARSPPVIMAVRVLITRHAGLFSIRVVYAASLVFM